MSLDTWKDEFYRVAANDRSIKTNLQAAQHSLRKWRGMTEENMDRHGVTLSTAGNLECYDGELWDMLAISSSSCALCHKHSLREPTPDCHYCPLRRIRNGARCDIGTSLEKVSPWAMWSRHASPDAMIRLLEKSVNSLTKEQQRKKTGCPVKGKVV